MSEQPPFTLVFEHPQFVVVDKCANCNFHDEGEVGAGLFNQVKAALACEELYPVHRLDKLTSGLVIMAKTKAAAQAFQQAFEAHQIEKFYLALSHDKPRKKQGLIKGDMAKGRRGSWKLLRSNENPAQTQFFSYSIGDGLRCFMVRPLTGRTHQIRVALKSIGSPISGDSLYGGKGECDRGYLHAYGLRFSIFGEDFNFICRPSQGVHFIQDGCCQLLESIAFPWQLKWPQIK